MSREMQDLSNTASLDDLSNCHKSIPLNVPAAR